MRKAVSTVYFLLIACCTATVVALVLGFYLKLEPAYAALEEEELFYCGTTGYMESYLAADIDPVLLLEVEGGKRLFDTNCSPCHDMTSVVVGPPLAGITERRDSAWVYSFIKNSQKMVEAGDSTAVQVYNEFSKMQMPAFDFADEQIDSIVSYISLYPNRP